MVTDKTRYRNMAKKIHELRSDGVSLTRIGMRFGVSQTTALRCERGDHPKWYRLEMISKRMRGEYND